MRLSPTGTIARRTFSASTVSSAIGCKPEALVKLLRLCQRLHRNSKMIDLTHPTLRLVPQSVQRTISTKRVRIALVLGNFGRVAQPLRRRSCNRDSTRWNSASRSISTNARSPVLDAPFLMRPRRSARDTIDTPRSLRPAPQCPSPLAGHRLHDRRHPVIRRPAPALCRSPASRESRAPRARRRRGRLC